MSSYISNIRSTSHSGSVHDHNPGHGHTWFDVGFSLGEDDRSRESRQVQDLKWKNAVADGRAHFSDRENKSLQSNEFKSSIDTFYLIEEMCVALSNRKSVLSRLSVELLKLIVDYSFFNCGVIVLYVTNKNVRLNRALFPPAVSKQGPSDPARADVASESPAEAVDDSSFKICIRKRPLNEYELHNGAYDCAFAKDRLFSQLTVHNGSVSRNGKQLSMKVSTYLFDRVWGEGISNESVCQQEIRPLFDHVAAGLGSATAICLGQTGTGKTYTMMGILQYLARRLVGRSVQVSFVELYGKNKCLDLLSARAECRLLSDDEGVVHTRGCVTYELEPQSEQDFLRVTGEALALRSSESTERNPYSSRSHAVLTLRLRAGAARDWVRLRVVDLAGSERNADTGSMSAQEHRESASINFDIMTLKDCIRSYHARARGETSLQRGAPRCVNPHNDRVRVRAPYRASPLTRVLRECFLSPGDLGWAPHRTLVIAALSPAPVDLCHSINTLEHVRLMARTERAEGGGDALWRGVQQVFEVCVEVIRSGRAYSHVPIERWSHSQVNEFLAECEGGRFSNLAIPADLDGAELMTLNITGLSSLCEGTLRASRREGEGCAWVVEAGVNRQSSIGKALWGALRRQQQAAARRQGQLEED